MSTSASCQLADAYFLILDIERARDDAERIGIRQLLHPSQRIYFDAWLGVGQALPILAVGRVFHRKPGGGHVMGGLPMAFCRGISALREHLRRYHAEACSDPLERVKASAFLVLTSDPELTSAIRAVISDLDGGIDGRVRHCA